MLVDEEEERLRMASHPLVRFVDGPVGRRPRLVGSGLDVWEVVATVKDNGDDTTEAAAYLEVPEAWVESAVAYYIDFSDEVTDGSLQTSASDFDGALAGRSRARRVRLTSRASGPDDWECASRADRHRRTRTLAVPAL